MTSFAADLGFAEGSALIEEVLFPDSRGGRRPQVPLAFEVVRELTPEDLPALRSGQIAPVEQSQLQTLRSSHHKLAQLLARGTPQEVASLATGYSVAYISRIKNADPAFRELMSFYEAERAAVFVDLEQRMHALGVDTLEELQKRLAEDPQGWTKRELMELAELVVGKRTGGMGQPGGAPPVMVSVQFVGGSPVAEGPTLDLQAREVEE